MNFCSINICLMRSVFWNYFQVHWCRGQLWLFNGPSSVTALQSLFNMRRPVACVNLSFAQFAPTHRATTSHNHTICNYIWFYASNTTQYISIQILLHCVVSVIWPFRTPTDIFRWQFCNWHREPSEWEICDIEFCNWIFKIEICTTYTFPVQWWAPFTASFSCNQTLLHIFPDSGCGVQSVWLDAVKPQK